MKEGYIVLSLRPREIELLNEVAECWAADREETWVINFTNSTELSLPNISRTLEALDDYINNIVDDLPDCKGDIDAIMEHVEDLNVINGIKAKILMEVY